MDLSLVKFIVVVQLSTSIVFMYCYVGSLTTQQFLRYSVVWYEIPWYKFSIDLQKLIPLIIANTQKPLIFQGFAIIKLNLAAFTKACVLNLLIIYLLFISSLFIIPNNVRNINLTEIWQTIQMYWNRSKTR